MKISLIHPPQPNVLDDMQYPPLGQMYIAAFLKKNSIDVSITDLAGFRENDWEKLIPYADVYGFTVYTASYWITKQLVKIARKKNPEALIVGGGAHPSALPQQTIEEGVFDCIVAGEGENAFFHLLENYKKTREYEKLTHYPLIKNLDELPFPARELVDLHRYTLKIEGKQLTPLISGRGCPYNCSFCYKGIFGSHLRLRSPESVIGEVKHIIDEYKIEAFEFFDDIFVLNRKRLYSILDGLEKLDIRFRCNGRAGVNTYEDYKKLKEAGCVEICFGIETGSQKLLDAINKMATVKQNKEAILNAKKAGLRTRAYMIFGLPGETRETIEETKRFIEEAKPHSAGLTTFVPLPGSDTWKNPEKYGIEIIDKDFKNFYTIGSDGTGGKVVRINSLPDEEFLSLNREMRAFVNKHNAEMASKNG